MDGRLIHPNMHYLLQFLICSIYVSLNPTMKMMYCGGGHLGFPIGIKNKKFVEDLPMIIHGQFGFNCPSGFREEAF